MQAFLLVPWRNTSSFIILFAWIITTNKNNAVRRDRTRPYCDQLSFEIYNEIHFNFFHAFLLSSSRRSAVALRACYGFDFEPIRAFTCFTAINTMSWNSFLVKYCTIWIFHISGWYFQTWCNFINIDTPPHHLINFISVKWDVTIFFFQNCVQSKKWRILQDLTKDNTTNKARVFTELAACAAECEWMTSLENSELYTFKTSQNYRNGIY